MCAIILHQVDVDLTSGLVNTGYSKLFFLAYKTNKKKKCIYIYLSSTIGNLYLFSFKQCPLLSIH